MELNFCLIDEKNRKSFEGVIPKALSLSANRIAIGAADKRGYVLGAVSYVLAEYEYYIDWIYVEPSVRRNKVGKSLISKVIDVVNGTGERYPITARFEYNENDSSMHTFFMSCDQMITTFSHDRYIVTPADVRRSEKLHKPSNNDITVVKFFDRSENEQKNILAMIAREQVYEVDNYDIWKAACAKDLCRCVYVRNNLVDLIIMQVLVDGNLELSFLYGKYPRGLFELLSQTVSDVQIYYRTSTISFDAVSEESQRLAAHLFPRARKVPVYEAEY